MSRLKRYAAGQDTTPLKRNRTPDFNPHVKLDTSQVEDLRTPKAKGNAMLEAMYKYIAARQGATPPDQRDRQREHRESQPGPKMHALRPVPKGKGATWSEPSANPRWPRPKGARPSATRGGIRWGI